MHHQFAPSRVLVLIAAAAAGSSATCMAQERFVLCQDRVVQSFQGLAVNPRTHQLALWLHTADAEQGPVGRHIAIFDLETRRLATTLPPPVGVRLSSLAYAPDGSALVSGENGSLLRVWDTETRTESILWEDERKRNRSGGATSEYRRVAFSASGDAIALIGPRTRREAQTLYIVDARSGELRSTIEPVKPPGFINEIAFSLDESCLAVSIADLRKRGGIRGRIELWDIQTRQRICTLFDGAGPLRMEMSPQRDVMATLTVGSDQPNSSLLRLWNLSPRPAKSDFSRFQASVPDCLCASFSPSGDMLAVGHLHPARRVTVYAVATGAVRYTLDHNEGQSIANVAFAGEDHLIVTIHRLAAEKAPTVLLWKLP